MADPKKPQDDATRSDMEGMATVKDDLDVADLYIGDEEFTDEAGLTTDDVIRVRDRYKVDGQPDYFNFREITPKTIEEHQREGTRTENDIYLRGLTDIQFNANSIQAHAAPYVNWTRISGYNSKSVAHTEFTKLHQPRHGETHGGKGIATLTRHAVMQTVGMSTIVNSTIATGCSANCSFCKESLIGRTYTEASISDRTGIIAVEYELDGIKYHYHGPSSARVKFYDPENGTLVFAPLEVALAGGFPISKDSLRKLSDENGNYLFRILAD